MVADRLAPALTKHHTRRRHTHGEKYRSIP